ncbi:MAG: hypothetical protein JW928_01300 [Candidatus Aureabacteria bacterium]|nr:hypothetical protein [Candidatus Auribacterota bacterium]
MNDFENKFNLEFGLKQNEGFKEIKIEGHPYRGYALKPGVVLNLEQYKNIPHVVDGLGHIVLREDKDMWKKAKQAREYRIFFTGGSTTGQPWCFYLIDYLNRKYSGKKRFKAINGGNGGYTSQENLSDLIFSGFSYDPDMVIAYLPVNDINLSAMYPEFKRDFTHFRIPFQLFEKSGSTIEKPLYSPRKYPFFLKMIDIMKYKEALMKYYNSIDLGRHIYKHPRPISKVIRTKNLPSFDETVEALIDNIYNMRLLCESRGVKFLLITQNIFPDKKKNFMLRQSRL